MPAASRKKPDVDTPCCEWSAMQATFELMSDCHDGGEALRQNPACYLPRHEAEPDDAYRERIEAAISFNFVKTTTDELAGRAFARRPQVTIDDKSLWKPFLDDVNAGEDAITFARRFFREGLLFGLGWSLVEARKDKPPRWLHIDPRDAYFVKKDDDGQLSEFRYKRITMEMDGFAEVAREELVRITKERVQVYRKVRKGYELHSNEANAAGFVPVVGFAPDPIGTVYVHPPLQDLAELQISHFRKMSDYDTSLRVSSFPILSMQTPDGGESQSLVVGPHSLVTLDPECEAGFIEHGGTALESLRANLRDLEERAGSYGAKLLKRRPSVETATARVIDANESSAPLQGYVLAFAETFRALIEMTAKMWPAGGAAPKVAFSTDFLTPDGSSQDLISLRQLGDLSRTDLLAELQRRGVLSVRFDPALNEARLADEVPMFMTARKGADHDHA